MYAASAALLLAIWPAAADEQLARLRVEVSVEGFKRWQRGEEYADSRISETYHLLTQVRSSGEASEVNARDPNFLQQQIATAAQVQQSLREARARAGKEVPAAATTMEEYLAQQQKLAEDMQRAQAACQGDVGCMMNAAQTFGQQAAMLAYPPAADAPAPATDLDEAPAEARYLDFYGYEGCPGEIHIVINNTSEGATADVSGMVPFRQADTADYRGSGLNVSMQCLASGLVYDLKTQRIYTGGIGFPTPRGRYYYWDRLHGETVNEDTEVTTTAPVWEWVAGQLQQAAASGSASTTLPITGDASGDGAATDGSTLSGEARVAMTWSFELL
ncbi:hypothetical protein GCM10027297_22300 [Parahaliea aestuarii]